MLLCMEKNQTTIQNLFFVPVPIFSLDIKKVLEAFRVHRIFKDNCAKRVHEQKKKDRVFTPFLVSTHFTQLKTRISLTSDPKKSGGPVQN